MNVPLDATALASAQEEPFVHPALFYRGSDEYLAGCLSFVREGLAAGEPVAVAVPGPNLALLRAELGGDAERVRMLDMTRAGRNPGRIIPGVLRAFADAHPDGHVRIIGEPIWAGRSEVEYPACAQHEALINLAFTGRDVTILCPYDVGALSPEVLADAEVTHPVVVDGDGRWRDSPAYDPDRVINGYNRPLPPPPDHAAQITGDVNTLGAARRWARAHADAAGLDEQRIVDVELVVTELLANSIRHGGGAATLRAWTDGGALVCEVTDRGHLSDPLAGRRPAPSGQAGGRGLLLVHHLSDLVRVHTTPDATTIRVYLHP
ncbi:Anti-sigma regulatory factor (Ser/Thr protein kinase) [Streptoalloteichus tenebrarius]|uniref:Anti-sigma regulatory factor (Ser/Thr protein kinase) n=1 Tax=Streptoalloteichus tenebrarius (strain ATCC 17920 / DSM 40477 / JCM 4838 / CBS 697.72 / NBRC 16177 / NCIMB 11028 / NRRL B-12390 / A12253. 1 / ISP 5477) TaxID=1933 RepID=A0ABT1HTI5_STRSD|nr:anti-sigma factor RsbA family regulatory protein [Streptoalloteichus tenebrarius]MCP2258839.1 Anti-sigma regulatory factor (Ser/Thr protein kinase) [Streptoalloteichus tenebrarius]BFE99476.1 sensor histidine kinase [Streptoalloteichus tenebrarius]